MGLEESPPQATEMEDKHMGEIPSRWAVHGMCHFEKNKKTEGECIWEGRRKKHVRNNTFVQTIGSDGHVRYTTWRGERPFMECVRTGREAPARLLGTTSPERASDENISEKWM